MDHNIDDNFTEVVLSLKELNHQQIKQLGNLLGLHSSSVQNMTTLPDEMVEAWLRKEGKVTETCGNTLTWEVLIDKLRKIGQNGVANKIAKEKCQDQDTAKNIDTDYSGAQSSSGHGVLSSSDTEATERDMSAGQSVQSADQSSYFQCHCKNHCTFDDYLSGKCCGSISDSFPFLDTTKLSKDQKEKLAYKLLNEVKKIIEKFGHFVCNTFKCLVEQLQMTVDRLASIVGSFGLQCEKHFDELNSCATVFQVQTFLFKYKYISFFNYDILEAIIEQTITEPGSVLEQDLQDYLAEFSKFGRRSVFEVPVVAIANSAPAMPSESRRLVFKIDENKWNKHKCTAGESSSSKFTLNDMRSVKFEIAQRVNIEPVQLLFVDTGKGCVQLTFVFLENVGIKNPASLQTLLTTINDPGIKNDLRQYGITVQDPITPFHDQPADQPLLKMREKQLLGEKRSHSSQRLLDEALCEGHVTTSIILLLLQGLAGVGKTCLKYLLLGEPPPSVRHSTPCAERPIRANIRSISGMKMKIQEGGGWKEINEDKLLTLIARAILALQHITKQTVSMDKLKQLTELLPLKDTSADGATSSQQPGDASLEPLVQSVDQVTSIDTQQPQDQSFDSKKTMDSVLEKIVGKIMKEKLKYEILECQDEDEKRFLEWRLKQLQSSNSVEAQPQEEDPDSHQSEQLFGSEWVYVTDSGGQPQFHELLPLFIHNTSATLFVTRLSESLDSRPPVEYYKDGKPVGEAQHSHFTTIDTLKCLIRSIQSRPTKGRPPKIIVVGTHKDLMVECSENLEQKNKKLIDLLGEYSDSLEFFFKDKSQLIFPVDTAHPGKEEEEIAANIRRIVEHTVVEKVKVPIWWYILELMLRQLANQLDREILSRSECLEVAQSLNFHEDAFDAALRFFHNLNVFHYHPNTLPEVVFVNSQVLLDKVTELVDFSFSLRQASCGPRSTMSGKWLCFRDQGIINIEFLEKFQHHYVKDLFTPQSFLKLLNKLLIAAPLTDDDTQPASPLDHFMPALLQMLPNTELEKHRVFSSTAAPLLIRFPEGWPRAGVFCCLVIHLMTVCGWRVTFSSGKIMLVARNCIKFQIPKTACYITLIDSFSHIEVHLKAPEKAFRKWCPEIQKAIISGIEASCRKLHYNDDHPSLAIFCPHTTDDDEETPSTYRVKPKPHAAEVIEEFGCWSCTIDELFGELNPQHTIWLTPLAPHTHESEPNVNIQHVSTALTQLLDWYTLGKLLGVKKSELDTIRFNFDKYGNACQRDQMVILWLHSDRGASWEKLCTALETMDQNTIACGIRTRFIIDKN